MKSPQPETRELNHRLTVPTYLVANQISILGRIGKSEMVEAALSYFFALTAIYAEATGQSTIDAARILVRSAPVCQSIPEYISGDPAIRELLSSIIGEIDKMTSESENKDHTTQNSIIEPLQEGSR